MCCQICAFSWGYFTLRKPQMGATSLLHTTLKACSHVLSDLRFQLRLLHTSKASKGRYFNASKGLFTCAIRFALSVDATWHFKSLKREIFQCFMLLIRLVHMCCQICTFSWGYLTLRKSKMGATSLLHATLKACSHVLSDLRFQLRFLDTLKASNERYFIASCYSKGLFTYAIKSVRFALSVMVPWQFKSLEWEQQHGFMRLKRLFHTPNESCQICIFSWGFWHFKSLK